MDHGTLFMAVAFLGSVPAPGENAVANHDEDALTMAVAAGIDCLGGLKREVVDGLYLATTSQPYMVRQNSALVATALDLQSSIRTADFIGSTKSGTTALLAALDAVRGETSSDILFL